MVYQTFKKITLKKAQSNFVHYTFYEKNDSFLALEI